MSRVEKAIAGGRCAIGLGAALLRDAEVMRQLTLRSALQPIALSGPAIAPVGPVNDKRLLRAIAQQNGVVCLIEPQLEDVPGLTKLGRICNQARQKPTILVVARSYNPFAFGSALQGLKVEHVKARGRDWVRDMPLPPAASELPEITTPAATKKASSASAIPAPRFTFVGREDELETLGGLLAEPGPIVVSGPPGIGKTWLVEHALAASSLKRLPDLRLSWSSAADALLTRLAGLLSAAGSDALTEALKAPHSFLEILPKVVETLQSAEATAEQVMVIRDLEFGLGRDQDFFRRSRLELLLFALLTSTYPLRLVFISTRQPRFDREGLGDSLRRVEVAGLKGRFFYDIFQAYKTDEFPRDKMGPISDRLHGHPMAARVYAIEVRDRRDGAELLDDVKFLKTESAGELEPLRKRIQKRLDKLSADDRAVLARLAHLNFSIDGASLADLGVKRNTRLILLSLGLLDMVGTEEHKRYQVHGIVRSLMSRREISDFDTYVRLGDLYRVLHSKTDDELEKLACKQEANRYYIAGRRPRNRGEMELPDQDAWLDSIVGMLRSRTPRLEGADQRAREATNRDPSNSDAWLMRLEAMQKMNAKFEDYETVAAEALEKAAVPELCQQVATFWLQRRQRVRAIAYLEAGMEVMPNQSRLKTRLASLLLRQGRRPEAIKLLEDAMAQDPMLPDAYGLLGQARRDEGLPAMADAEVLLREAVRLAPDDLTQVSRLTDYLMVRARVDHEHQRDLREQAQEFLTESLKGTRRAAPESQLQLATLIRELGGDLERARWLLGKARKGTDRQHGRNTRIRVELAMVALAGGEVDAGEKQLREIIQRDPTNASAFAALGHVLEAREMYIPAHAEYQRAKERSAQNSLECLHYDQNLVRVQAIIEAQVAGMFDTPEPEPEPETDAQPAAFEPKVKRRSAREMEARQEAPDSDDAKPEEAPVDDAPVDVETDIKPSDATTAEE
jgi:tetratricopeptide (TPR) repeat protein